MRVALRELAQQADPKSALLDALGDMSWYEVFHNLVLVASYIRPEKSAGGIIRPDNTLQEDRFQGKAGLVIKVGPAAFVDEGHVKFYGLTVQSGEWVIYRTSDALEHFVRRIDTPGQGLSCRLIQDIHIKARVADPAFVY
jgi:co-chaperonin GroES (HSP10)